MAKSTKAALLSALVFPGAGHFFLKKHITGAVLAVAALVPLYLIISKMIERAVQITDQIMRGTVPLDLVAITEYISKQPAGTRLLNIAWVVLVISWLLAIVDSYRIGLSQDH